MNLFKSVSCVLLLLGVQMGFSADFFVNNGNNEGSGSLRQAILNANTSSGSDNIVFNFGGTIELESTITITRPLTISNNGVLVDIEAITNDFVCFEMTSQADNCTIRDLKLTGFQVIMEGANLSNIHFENIETVDCVGFEYILELCTGVSFLDITSITSSGGALISCSESTDLTVNNYEGRKGFFISNTDEIDILNSTIGTLQATSPLGIQLTNTADVLIENNEVIRVDNGISINNGNNVTLRGNTVRNSFNQAIILGGQDFFVLDNRVFDDEDTEGAIDLTNMVNATVQGNELEGRIELSMAQNCLIGGPNVLDRNTITASLVNKVIAGGITVRNSSNNNIIQNNLISNYPLHGISLIFDSQNNTIIDNEIVDNGKSGIRLSNNGFPNVLTRNSIHRNGPHNTNLVIPNLRTGIIYEESSPQPAPNITSALATNQGVVLTGTAEANDEIEIFFDTIRDNLERTEDARVFVGNTVANGSGNWSLTIPFMEFENFSGEFPTTATSAVNGTSEFSNARRFGIEGRQVLCNLFPITYSVPEIPGATYNWWVGGGDKGGYVNFVDNNNSSAEVQMKFVRTYPTLVIEFFTLNVQVNTPTENYILKRTVVSFPCLDNVITVGPTDVCRGEPNTYAVLGREGDTYNWWVNGEASFDTRSSNQVEITFGQSFTSGTVVAQVQNQLCGTLNTYTFDVMASTCNAKIGESLSGINSCSPNPFSYATILNLDEGIERVEIHNSAGILIDEFKLDSDSKSLELGQNYPSGVYLISMIKGLEVEQVKVVKD